MTTTNLSVERALIILRHLSRTDQGMGIRELNRELGISPAGVQKIINVLHPPKPFFNMDAGTTSRFHGRRDRDTGLSGHSS